MVVPWKCIPGLRGSNHNIQTYDSVEHGVTELDGTRQQRSTQASYSGALANTKV